MLFYWRRKMVFWAIVFICIGVFVWLGNLGIFNFRWGRDWPVILVIIGLYFLIQVISPRRRKRRVKKGLDEILKRLERGEVSAEEAASELEE